MFFRKKDKSLWEMRRLDAVVGTPHTHDFLRECALLAADILEKVSFFQWGRRELEIIVLLFRMHFSASSKSGAIGGEPETSKLLL